MSFRCFSLYKLHTQFTSSKTEVNDAYIITNTVENAMKEDYFVKQHDHKVYCS